MRRAVLFGMLSLLAVAFFAPPLFAQVLHTNDRWDECSFVIDPALTQDAWHQFVSEFGLVIHFRPLASAEPLGRKNFEIALLDWGTRINDADAAWNDTFSHPDSTHWLFDGDALLIPGLMTRVGITDRIDVGGYFTKNPNANYGFLGGLLQYNLLNDTQRGLAAAGRVSFNRLFGPEDLEASTYGLDVLVSKDVSRFSPYVGVSGYLARGQETTSTVDLDDESVFGVQAMTGIVARVSVLRLGAEFNLAEVVGYSFKVAAGF